MSGYYVSDALYAMSIGFWIVSMRRRRDPWVNWLTDMGGCLAYLGGALTLSIVATLDRDVVGMITGSAGLVIGVWVLRRTWRRRPPRQRRKHEVGAKVRDLAERMRRSVAERGGLRMPLPEGV